MHRTAAVALLAALAPVVRASAATAGMSARATVALGGAPTQVRWTDGDSFVVLTGPYAGRRARLAGVNALETHGPVHRLGRSGGRELLGIARRSAAVAAAAGGRCESDGAADGYGRLLVRCPEAAQALVRAGHAMVLAVDAPPDAALVALQGEAQRRRAGIWAGGAPPLVPTSLHSAGEAGLGPRGAYDRIADTRTGATEVRRHDRVYRTCEEVCVGEGADRACLVYVPYERHYRDRPSCLAPASTASPPPRPDPE
jgi:endonuclease YncB( thermonuclease family)